MATQFSLIEFLIEQIKETGEVSYKKMFGEYMIYLNAKPIFIICDGTLFVKALPLVEDILESKNIGQPYQGCKQPHYIVEDIDNREMLCNLALFLEKVTPLPKPKKKSMSELGKIPNIGVEIEKQLNSVGITTYQQLKEEGSKNSWLKILAIDPSACYNRLCGLEGAIRKIRWHQLPDEVKKELKDFYNMTKGK